MNQKLRNDIDYIVENTIKEVLPDEAVSRALNNFSYGKGKVIVLGFSLGFTYSNTHQESTKEMLEALLKDEHISKKLNLHAINKALEKMDNAEIVAPESQKPKGKMYHGVELLPLDEIKAPDLKPNGYSIFYK